MMGILDQLMKIKDFRENRAQVAVQVERVSMERKANARDRAADQLDAFRGHLAEREAELFRGLMGQAVQVRDIQEVRHEIGELRSQERGLAGVLDRAVSDCENQRKALETAKSDFRLAMDCCEKFRGLVDADHTQKAWDSERLEESDGEEVARLPHLSPLQGDEGWDDD